MGPNGFRRRIEKNMASAVEAVKAGKMTVRRAASRFHVAKSTLQDRITKGPPAPLSRWTLSVQEEDCVVYLLDQYAQLGASLNRRHLADALAIIVQRMPADRRARTPIQKRPPRTTICTWVSKETCQSAQIRPSYPP